jgi:hypothetical protein
MTGLVAAAARLADILARENAALADLDFRRATTLLAEKEAAAAAFSSAHAAAKLAKLDHAQRRALEAAAGRLRSVGQENRRLLERAIVVQGRVLGSIAKAVARAAPRVQASAYAANGMRPESRRLPVMFSARA